MEHILVHNDFLEKLSAIECSKLTQSGHVFTVKYVSCLGIF